MDRILLRAFGSCQFGRLFIGRARCCRHCEDFHKAETICSSRLSVSSLETAIECENYEQRFQFYLVLKLRLQHTVSTASLVTTLVLEAKQKVLDSYTRSAESRSFSPEDSCLYIQNTKDIFDRTFNSGFRDVLNNRVKNKHTAVILVMLMSLEMMFPTVNFNLIFSSVACTS